MTDEFTPKCYDAKIGGVKADPYRILDAYEITNPCQQHAIKKLLRVGESHKTRAQEIQEVIDTLKRWQEMMGEDAINDWNETA